MARFAQGRIGALGAKPKYPARLFNYLAVKLVYRLGWTRAPFLPAALDIEPNNTCNFRCPHCQVPYWNKPAAFLDGGRFATILKQAPHLVRIKLQGMGEPLLNKHLVGMLKLGEARGVSMGFFSNASVLSDETAATLADLDDTEITFSLDGASKETFERIRAGGKFEKAVGNMRRLVAARGAKRHPVLSGWTLATKENIGELARIVRLAKDIGLDRLTIQTFLSDWGKTEMKERTGAYKIDRDSEALAAAVADAEKAAREIGLDLGISRNDYYSRRRKCVWPWTGAYIAANGDVVPCCVIADSDTAKMGNVFERDFAEIWNSPAYREFRKRIRNHDLPDYCRNCYLDPDR
jgi:radical SAM protein with 4Fe4S-binding SPASM domain